MRMLKAETGVAVTSVGGAGRSTSDWVLRSTAGKLGFSLKCGVIFQENRKVRLFIEVWGCLSRKQES